jgi:hypothetical protein
LLALQVRGKKKGGGGAGEFLQQKQAPCEEKIKNVIRRARWIRKVERR